jgi:hypothetical protein
MLASCQAAMFPFAASLIGKLTNCAGTTVTVRAGLGAATGFSGAALWAATQKEVIASTNKVRRARTLGRSGCVGMKRIPKIGGAWLMLLG